MSLQQDDFANVLIQQGHCSDIDEAHVLADLVYQEIPLLSETSKDGDNDEVE